MSMAAVSAQQNGCFPASEPNRDRRNVLAHGGRGANAGIDASELICLTRPRCRRCRSRRDRRHLGRLALDHDRPGSVQRVALLVVIVLPARSIQVRCRRSSKISATEATTVGGGAVRRHDDASVGRNLLKRLPLLDLAADNALVGVETRADPSPAPRRGRPASNARRAALDQTPGWAARAPQRTPAVGGEAERRRRPDPVAGLSEPPRPAGPAPRLRTDG